MPVLNFNNADELANQIERMTSKTIRKEFSHIKYLLDNKSVIVRWAAVQALGRARLGADELLKRLQIERNLLVLMEITESLASLKLPESLPDLYTLAEQHTSGLVRSRALLAVSDIKGKGALPFLQDRRSKEKSRYVKATADILLFVQGAEGAIHNVTKALESSDVRIRRLTANLIRYYRPRRERASILRLLTETLARENHPGARGDLELTIKELESTS